MSGHTFDFLAIAEKRANQKSETPIDPYNEFTHLLQSYGFDITSIAETVSRVERVKPTDSRKKTCWYTFHMIENVGYGNFGDWRDGEKHEFVSTSYKTLSPEEKRRIDKAREVKRITDEAVLKAKRNKAAKQAMRVISLCDDVPEDFEHRYLSDKKVRAFGLKVMGRRLVIPVYVGDKIRSYQAIDEKQVKMFLKNGEIEGGYHFIRGNNDKTYFVEGYATGATIHQATKSNVMVCFNASNLPKVVKYYRSVSQDPIIIAADNDWKKEKEGKGNAGIKYAEKCCKEFTNVTMIYPDFIQGTDFNDMACERGIDHVKDKLGTSRNRLKIEQVDQMEAKPEKWFIKKVLPEKKLALLFGQSGHMKSFVILDIALHLAAGLKDWHGNQIKNQTDILYVCGEGASGIRNRVIAWKEHHGIKKPIPFYMTSSPVMFMERDQTAIMLDSLNDFMYDNKVKKYPSIIIIDTLNRNFGAGDENSTKDMTSFINALEEIHATTGSMFIVVHHSSKGELKQARGNASLKNACDCEYQVDMINYQAVKDGDESPKIEFSNTKMKDYSFAEKVLFAPVPIVLGKDEDGDDITSVALRKIDENNAIDNMAMNETQKVVYAFQRAVINIAQINMRSGTFNTNKPMVSIKLVDIEFAKLCGEMGINEHTRKKFRRKAVDEAAAKGSCYIENREVYITSREILRSVTSQVAGL